MIVLCYAFHASLIKAVHLNAVGSLNKRLELEKRFWYTNRKKKSYAFSRRSSHWTHTGFSSPARRKYRPSSNGPLHSCIQLATNFSQVGWNTDCTTKTLLVPLCTKCFDDHICNRLTALFTLGGVAVSVTVDAPCVVVFFNKRCLWIKRLFVVRTL